jgi:hypothetical protein
MSDKTINIIWNFLAILGCIPVVIAMFAFGFYVDYLSSEVETIKMYKEYKAPVKNIFWGGCEIYAYTKVNRGTIAEPIIYGHTSWGSCKNYRNYKNYGELFLKEGKVINE